ncbi:MAG: GTP-binding protein [Myxococcota bacterium]
MTVGWVCWRERRFDSDALERWLDSLATDERVRRAKAVVHTNGGWSAFNLADAQLEQGATGYRRDSRIELVIEGASLPDPDALEAELERCLLPA